MQKAQKYIITRIRIDYTDGTHNTVKTRKEVYNVDSYREYLMIKYNAARVEFIYDTIPASRQGEIRLII
jgi:hypothetical protein